MDKTCIECGLKYEYNSMDPRGASSVLCPTCQKRDSRWTKRLKLLLIAGNGEVRCRSCGYSRYPRSITMIDGRDRLFKVTPEKQASESFLVCFNCEGAIKTGYLRYAIDDINSHPIKVSFYDTRVNVVEVKMADHIRETSPDAIEAEIVNETKTPKQLRSVSRKTHRMGGSNPGDLSGMRGT